MKLLLDTCIFNEKRLLSCLKTQAITKVELFINSIIYLELGFIYYVRQKWKLFATLMKELKIKNLDITQSVAEQAIKAAMSFKNTTEGASYYFRDCLIGATANIHNLILITNNIKDFAWLPKESCLTPTQIIIQLTEES